MAVVGTAVIDVIANTAKFAAGMAAAERRIGSLKSVIDVLAAAGLAKLTRDALSSAAAIGDMARQAGFGVRAYQELSYAAKQLDVSQQALDSGLQRLNKTLGDAKRTGEGGVFKDLGLDPTFLSTAEQAFDAVIVKLRGIRDESVRASYATQLFGKEAGPQLAQMLDAPADKLKRLREEAQRVGAVLSKDVIDKADGAEKKLDSLAKVTRTQMTVALVELAPVITAAGEAAALSARGWALLSVEIEKAYTWFEKWLRTGSSGFDPSKTNEAHRQKVAELQSVYAELNLAIARVEKQGGASAGARIAVLERRRDEVKRELDALKGEQRKLIPEKDPDAAPPPPPFVSTSAAMKDAAALEEHINGIYERNIELLTGKSAAALQYEATLTDLNELLARGTITQEEYNAAVERAQTEFEKTGNAISVYAEQAARNMQSAFADFLFDPFKDGLKGMLNGFVQILRRMAAEALAARIFEAIGDWGTANKGAGGGLGAIATFASFFGGGRAAGGPVAPGMMYEVNERGDPEMLSSGGRDYLLMGSKGGQIAHAKTGPSLAVDARTYIDARNAVPEMMPQLQRMQQESEARVEARVYQAIRRGTNP